MSHNSIIDGGTDPKLFMEAMMGEMKACDEVGIRADSRADKTDGEYTCGPATTHS